MPLEKIDEGLNTLKAVLSTLDRFNADNLVSLKEKDEKLYGDVMLRIETAIEVINGIIKDMHDNRR